MSIQRAEQLKRDWTDQFVVVRKGVPELRRFDGFVGQVKTVNMNCRLLIQFDTAADISWYDIDPQFVSVVELAERNPPDTATEPLKSSSSAAPEGTNSAAAPVAQPTSSANPMDIIRRQSAAKNSGDRQTSRPLDQIRAQATGGVQDTAAAKEPAHKAENRNTPADSPVVTPPAGESPLDRIRAQAARTQSTDPVAPVQSANDSAPASPVSSDTSGIETPAGTPDPFRVGTASSTPKSGSDKSDTDADPGYSKVTSGTQAAIDIRIPSPIDQIRAQATADGQTSSFPSTLFEQIRSQAAEP